MLNGVPSFETPLVDVTLLSGSPLHIPLDGYDPEGQTLTYEATSDNEAAVTTFITSGNRSIIQSGGAATQT